MRSKEYLDQIKKDKQTLKELYLLDNLNHKLFSKFGKDKIGTEFIIYESPDSESDKYLITKFFTPLLGSSIKDAM